MGKHIKRTTVRLAVVGAMLLGLMAAGSAYASELRLVDKGTCSGLDGCRVRLSYCPDGQNCTAVAHMHIDGIIVSGVMYLEEWSSQPEGGLPTVTRRRTETCRAFWACDTGGTLYMPAYSRSPGQNVSAGVDCSRIGLNVGIGGERVTCDVELYVSV